MESREARHKPLVFGFPSELGLVMMLAFFNLVLAWNIVPSDWKSGEVVPVVQAW